MNDPGKQGRQIQVPKETLTVDPAYQRPLNVSRAENMARNFNWAAFGALTVYRRPNGDLKIVVGQHRWQAALRRPDITKVPCVVFENEKQALAAQRALEAKTFIGESVETRNISAYRKHKAGCVARHPLPRKVQELIDSSGRELSEHGGPTSIRCIQKITSLMKNYEAELRRIWPIMVEASEGTEFYEDVLDGLVYLERFANQSITEERWATRVISTGSKVLRWAIQQEAAQCGYSGSKVRGLALMKRLNKGLRSKKLKIDEISILEG